MDLIGVIVLFLCISLPNAYPHGNVDAKLSILKDRMRMLETRLTEDISLIRKELYSEISSVKETMGIADMPALPDPVTTNDPLDADQFGIINDVKQEINSLKAMVDVLQNGFRVEKVTRRDLQEQIRMEEVKTAGIANSISELENFLKIKLDEMKPVRLTEITEEIKQILEDQQAGACNVNENMQTANDCSDWLRKGHVTSGVYEIHPATLWRPLRVYCDMTTDGGGWTVMQRRCDGSENFYRPWNDYRFGFGNLSAEFWLGNEFVHRIMKLAPQELRIELEDFDNDKRFAHYNIFDIASADESFKIQLEDFSGNVTDSFMPRHNGKAFSTYDKGPDANCATTYKGAFWYSDCHAVNINGEYLMGEHKSYANGVNWKGFRGYNYSLKFTEMKFRSK